MGKPRVPAAMCLPLHPFAVALLPVLSMYAARLGRSHVAEAAAGAAVVLLAVAVAMVVATLVFGSARKAGMAVTACTAALLTYDVLFAPLEGTHVGGVLVGRHRYLLLAVFGSLAAAGLWLHATVRTLATTTTLLNVVAGGALLVPLSSLVAFETRRALAPPPRAELATPAAARRPAPLPDIYYFIFDRYADAATLREVYEHDNQALIGFLEQAGFYVAADSRSNYLTTTLSVASSLNFTFLNELAARNGSEATDWLPIFQMIRHHRLGEFLQSQGYHYVHAGGWWWPSQRHGGAERNINYYTAPPRPVIQLLDSGLLAPARWLTNSAWIDDRYQQWTREGRKVAALLAVPRDDRPTFVFAHMLIPHPPYVFERDGSFLPLDEANRRTWGENYVNQVVATNGYIVRLVREILARSTVPPIIVIQSDEGPYPERYRAEHDDFEWRSATPAEVREKTGILNAYYLPGSARERLYPAITPVNSFRVVLSEYFGADLPLLPDTTYGHESDRKPYNMFDLTQETRHGRRQTGHRRSSWPR